MKPFALALAVCLLPLGAWAEDYTLRLTYTKAPAREVLRVYEKLSTQPVYLSVGVDALVTVVSEKEIPATEAIELIRKTLLERYGIELRKNDAGEILADWSKDPKYPRGTDEAAALVDQAGRRLRVIEARPAN